MSSAMAKQQTGFSLIEVMLVVVLIGGIVAFAASRILGGSDRAKVNLAKAQVQTMAEKITQYKTDTGQFPQRLGDLEVVPQGVVGWLGPYAKSAEFKDPWGNTLQYTVPANGTGFNLLSLGRDGQPGGASVDADIGLP